MTGQVAAWKKAKPLTFGSEPLSAALKDLDAMWAKFTKDMSRENIAGYSGALKNSAVACATTMKKVNPKSDKKLYDWLARREADLKAKSFLVTSLQKKFAEFMQGTLQGRKEAATALQEAVDKTDMATVDRSLKVTQTFGKWLNESYTGIGIASAEIVQLAQASGKATLLLGELKKELTKLTPNSTAEEKKKIGNAINNIRKETHEQVERLKMPMKFVGIKNQAAMKSYDVLAE
jgi:hypothetical protein